MKLANHLGCLNLAIASAETVKRLTGADVGYAGPVGLPDSVEVVWYHSTRGRVNFECGGNKTNFHNLNVNFGRDVVEPKEFIDIREVKEEETCSKCQKGRLHQKHGIELAHVFKLGTLYSNAMGAKFTDQNGEKKPIVMGCYGIGMSRALATIVEVFHDEKGITWPEAVAPFQVHLISLPGGEAVGEDVYDKLTRSGVSVLWDERDVSAGIKFSDCDLIGIPTRLVVSRKTGDTIEVKKRSDSEATRVPLAQFLQQYNNRTM